MYLEVYLDVLFFVNFGMDYLILKIVKMIIKQKSSRLRLLSASAIGAIGACVMSLCPNLNPFAKFIFLYLFTGLVMIVIAFKTQGIGNRMKSVIILFMVTYLIGGMLNSIYSSTNFGYYLNQNLPFLTISALFCYSLIKCAFWLFKRFKGETQNLYETEIIIGEKKVTGRGLLDTGNRLREPVSKKPVMIAEYKLMEQILPESAAEYILKFYHSSGENNFCAEAAQKERKSFEIPKDNIAVKLRYIPYNSIGREKGMLIGIVCNQVNIQFCMNNCVHDTNVIVAVYDGALSGSREYNMILHEELVS